MFPIVIHTKWTGIRLPFIEELLQSTLNEVLYVVLLVTSSYEPSTASILYHLHHFTHLKKLGFRKDKWFTWGHEDRKILRCFKLRCVWICSRNTLVLLAQDSPPSLWFGYVDSASAGSRCGTQVKCHHILLGTVARSIMWHNHSLSERTAWHFLEETKERDFSLFPFFCCTGILKAYTYNGWQPLATKKRQPAKNGANTLKMWDESCRETVLNDVF